MNAEAAAPISARRTVLLLAAVLAISVIPVSMVLPMLPGIARSYQASSLEVSLLYTLFPVITVFSAPLWGHLSDRIGRKPVLIVALVGSGIGLLVFALADSLLLLFVGRGIQGVMSGTAAVAFAIIADVSAPQARAAAIGRLSGSFALGFAIGPLIGGLLTPAGATFDHAPASLLGTAMLVGVAVLAMLILPETNGRERRSAVLSGTPADQKAARQSPLSVLLATPVLRVLGMFYVGVGLTSSTVVFAYTLWAGDVAGWEPRMIGFGTSAIGGAFLLSNFVIVALLTRAFGEQVSLRAGLAVQCAGLGVFVLTGSVAAALVGLIIGVIGEAIATTTISALFSRNAPAHMQGAMMGLGSGLNMVGRVIGPILGGIGYDRIDPTAPFAMCLLVAVAMLGWALVRSLRRRRQRAVAHRPGSGPSGSR